MRRPKNNFPIGTWGFKIGSRMIADTKFKQNWPRGIYGKVIENDHLFHIVLRAYTSHGICHIKCERSHFKSIT